MKLVKTKDLIKTVILKLVIGLYLGSEQLVTSVSFSVAQHKVCSLIGQFVCEYVLTLM